MKPRRAITAIVTVAACAIPASAAASSVGSNSATVWRHRYEYTPGSGQAVHREFKLRKGTVTHVGRTLTFRWYVAKLSHRLARPCVEFDLATGPRGSRGFVALSACRGVRRFYYATGSKSLRRTGRITSHYGANYVQWSGVPSSLWPRGQRQVWGQVQIGWHNSAVVGTAYNNIAFTPHR